MSESDGLLWALVLDGKGGARVIGRDEIATPLPAGQILWLHWDRKHAAAAHWLQEESGLDATICEALLAEETRPRSLEVDHGLLAILRGVNFNEGADPEDMVAIRMWIDSTRVITFQTLQIMAAQDVRESLEQGRGPASPGEFLVKLTTRLIERMGPVIESLDDLEDQLEEELLDAQSYTLRSRLGNVRRQAIAFRRYVAPQRDVMLMIYAERVPWMTELDHARIREAADRLTRYAEDLDACRERAAVTQEELANRLAEQMNRNMYVLSLVAAVFLPLGFLTGLLGINVGGIPGTESNWAFAIVCVFLGGVAGCGIWLLRRLKLF